MVAVKADVLTKEEAVVTHQEAKVRDRLSLLHSKLFIYNQKV